MRIDDVIEIAKRIDGKAESFKANSTRESRNARWAFIIGCVHHGHSIYNPNPDPSWFLKSAGGGRPQSDDVAVHMPDRNFWDCVTFSGTDNAIFQATPEGILPSEQIIITPPRPETSPVPIPSPVPVPTPQPNPNDDKLLILLENLIDSCKELLIANKEQTDSFNKIFDFVRNEQYEQFNKIIANLENMDKQFLELRKRMDGKFRIGW